MPKERERSSLVPTLLPVRPQRRLQKRKKNKKKRRRGEASLEFIVENQFKSAWPFWNTNHKVIGEKNTKKKN